MTTCNHPDCDRASVTKGFCDSHYRRVLRGTRATGPLRERMRQPDICSVPACDRFARTKGLCHSHFARTRTGRTAPLDTPIRPAVRRRRLAHHVIVEELSFGISITELAKVYDVDPESILATLRRHRRNGVAA